MTRLFVQCVILLAFCSAAGGDDKIQVNPAAESELFRKGLGDGREIVVVRGPYRDPADVRGLLPAEHLADASKVFAVRFEAHTKAGTPLVLWAGIRCELTRREAKGFDVLDVMAEPGQVVAAVAEFGGVWLWRLQLATGSVSMTMLRGGEWSAAAAVQPIDRRDVRVTLKRSPTSHRLIAEVTDLRPPDRITVAFEQAGQSWDFARVKAESSITGADSGARTH